MSVLTQFTRRKLSLLFLCEMKHIILVLKILKFVCKQKVVKVPLYFMLTYLPGKKCY